MRPNPRHMRAMFRSLAFGLLVGIALVPRPAFAQDPFIGEIRWVGFNFAPRGWASCNGQILSIAQNTALFSLLGTTYGGNGQTTFALPDMRGRVPLHFGQGPGLSNRDLGEVAGTETVTLILNEIPSHAHNLSSHSHTIPSLPVEIRASNFAATKTSPAGSVLATPSTNIYSSGLAGATLAAGSALTLPGATDSATGMTTAAGGGQPHLNMPPFLAIHCIIALEGIFPSRN
jgi:microcystin-dependent protein